MSAYEQMDVSTIVASIAESNQELAQNSIAETISHINGLKQTIANSRLPPTTFDARLEWPLCWTVHQVPNQGGCGSCWVSQ